MACTTPKTKNNNDIKKEQKFNQIEFKKKKK